MDNAPHKTHHVARAGVKKEKKDVVKGKTHDKGFNEKVLSLSCLLAEWPMDISTPK